MKLQTIVDIKPSEWKIGYEDKILMLGSCFSDEIGEQMKQRYMSVTCNPFGTLYNPISIAQAMQMKEMPELIEYDGLWHSMYHHGSFSRADKQEAEKAVQASIDAMQQALKESNVVIVTFGTAWVYEWSTEYRVQNTDRFADRVQNTDRITVVGNCHKMPEKWFSRRRLSVEEIVAVWRPIIEQYPDKHWIFTVSPIRHIRDGLHENQLSKATLLQAVEAIRNTDRCADRIQNTDRITYFPSYEILLDELRDYRFYADDLVHPSSLAVQYIWERFVETYCTTQTKNELVLQHKRWKHEHHIPLH